VRATLEHLWRISWAAFGMGMTCKSCANQAMPKNSSQPADWPQISYQVQKGEAAMNCFDEEMFIITPQSSKIIPQCQRSSYVKREIMEPFVHVHNSAVLTRLLFNPQDELVKIFVHRRLQLFEGVRPKGRTHQTSEEIVAGLISSVRSSSRGIRLGGHRLWIIWSSHKPLVHLTLIAPTPMSIHPIQRINRANGNIVRLQADKVAFDKLDRCML